MQLNKSIKAQTYGALLEAINTVITQGIPQDDIDVDIDYSFFKNEISLEISQSDVKDSRVVHVVAGNGIETTVSYFGHRSIINNTFDPFGLKALNGEKSVAFEYRHNKSSMRNSGHRSEEAYRKFLTQLAIHIVQFLSTGIALGKDEMVEEFPLVGQSILYICEPKLK